MSSYIDCPRAVFPGNQFREDIHVREISHDYRARRIDMFTSGSNFLAQGQARRLSNSARNWLGTLPLRRRASHAISRDSLCLREGDYLRMLAQEWPKRSFQEINVGSLVVYRIELDILGGQFENTHNKCPLESHHALRDQVVHAVL